MRRLLPSAISIVVVIFFFFFWLSPRPHPTLSRVYSSLSLMMIDIEGTDYVTKIRSKPIDELTQTHTQKKGKLGEIKPIFVFVFISFFICILIISFLVGFFVVFVFLSAFVNRFLSVKKWLLRKKHQVELARKRGWRGYWVCLKGTTLLFYPCDSREGRHVEAAPKHLIIVDGAIMQPIPEHPQRDFIFCLSTAFGDAYLFQVNTHTHPIFFLFFSHKLSISC